MRKVWLIIMAALVLTGCATSETFETVADDYAASQALSPSRLTFEMPADAAAPVIQGNDGALYFCDGYEIMVQTVAGGDLSRTLRLLTGYDPELLTVLSTQIMDMAKHECAWISVGEAGDYVGRTVIIDDGAYHYSLSVMAPAEEAGSLQESWQELFSSVGIQS